MFFHPAVPVPCIGTYHGVCRALGRVWVAHGRLSASCCTPNGGWSITYPCTLFPLGSPTKFSPAAAPSCERMGLKG